MKVSEEEFIDLWNKYGSATKIASILDIGVRSVFNRRKKIEARTGQVLQATDPRTANFSITYPGNGVRARAEIENGVIMVASDCHYALEYIHLIQYLEDQELV